MNLNGNANGRHGPQRLAVNDLYRTIQGEGAQTGVPMVLIRLHGCSVGCPWCFAADTPVLMADWSQKAIQDVVTGDMVMSYGGGRSYTLSRVVSTSNRIASTVRVVTDRGDSLVTTPDHVFHVNHHRSRGARKLPAGELAGRWIKRSKIGNHAAREVTESYIKGYLKGAYAGDGSASHWGGYTKIFWQVCDRDFAERLSLYVNRFGRETTVTESSRRTARGKVVYRVSCVLTGLEFIFDLPEDQEEVRGYVGGFFDAEGSASEYQVSLCQQDDKLLHRVESMLSGFGFFPSWGESQPDRNTGEAMHSLLICGIDDCERFIATFTPAIARKTYAARSSLSRQLTAHQVADVVPSEARVVYNLMTTMGNFFANGYLVDQCDTRETWERIEEHRVERLEDALGPTPAWAQAEPREVAALARRVGPELAWALVTGGEPAEQNLTQLGVALREREYRIAVETSGTASGHLDMEADWVCCSPKPGMPGGKTLLPAAVASADEIKMVIGKPADLDRLQRILDHYPIKPDCQVCLQPLSGSRKATDLCLDAALRLGYRLSVQTHKAIGVR